MQPAVGCYNSWDNLRCSSCSPLGENSLWNGNIEHYIFIPYGPKSINPLGLRLSLNLQLGLVCSRSSFVNKLLYFVKVRLYRRKTVGVIKLSILLLLKSEQEWIMTSHCFTWMVSFIHAPFEILANTLQTRRRIWCNTPIHVDGKKFPNQLTCW